MCSDQLLKLEIKEKQNILSNMTEVENAGILSDRSSVRFSVQFVKLDTYFWQVWNIVCKKTILILHKQIIRSWKQYLQNLGVA